jgi:hypothetical protein
MTQKSIALLRLAQLLEVSEYTSIPCNNMDIRAKLIVETRLAEQKIILWWPPDFHHMTIALPHNKSHAYWK